MRVGWTRTGPGLVLLVVAASGCCLGRAESGTRGNRDSPERAFAFVRDAFVDDRTGDQIDSFHQDFREAHGISSSGYSGARTLYPGKFEKMAALLKDARIEGPVERRVGMTRAGPRAMAVVTLTTSSGGKGVFELVDEPRCRVLSDDPQDPESFAPPPDMARAARIEGEDLVVNFRTRLYTPPAAGAHIERVEIFHDWLLYEIRSLEGFDEFLQDVRKTAEESRGTKEEPPR